MVMESHDRWFALVLGTCFVVCSKWYGRAIANGREGPLTPEERTKAARRDTFVARALGGALVAYAVWRFIER